MTREEAVKFAEHAVNMTDIPEVKEFYRMAAVALTLPTQEQVNKAWRGEWVGMTDDDGCTWYECSRCEYDLDSLEEPNQFCPVCGAPMTDEAVEMVMERLEALKDDQT